MKVGDKLIVKSEKEIAAIMREKPFYSGDFVNRWLRSVQGVIFRYVGNASSSLNFLGQPDIIVVEKASDVSGVGVLQQMYSCFFQNLSRQNALDGDKL